MSVQGELLFFTGFGRGGLSDALRNNESGGVGKHVAAFAASDFVTKSDDQLVAEVLAHSRCEPLTLLLGKATGGAEETTISVQSMFGDTVHVAGLRVTKSIPFAGDAELFKLQPDEFDLNPPRGTVRNRKLIVGMDVRAAQAEEAIRYIDDTVRTVQIWIDRQAAAIAASNARLAAAAHTAIEARRRTLDEALMIAKRLSGA